MKRKDLIYFKQAIESCTTGAITDEKIIDFIKMTRQLTKEQTEQQAFIEELQKKCNVEFSPTTRAMVKGEEADYEKFANAQKQYGDEDILLPRLLSEKEVNALRKDNASIITTKILDLIMDNIMIVNDKPKNKEKNGNN